MTTPARGTSRGLASLVETTRQCLRSASAREGRLWSRTPHLDLRVSSKGLTRGLAIYAAILREFERAEIRTALEEGKTFAFVDGERLQLTVREIQVRRKHVPTANETANIARYPAVYGGDRWDLVPTGQFVFVLEDNLLWRVRTQWIEGSRRKMEDHLGSIVEGVRAAARSKSAHRLEIEQRTRDSVERARREEALRAERLQEQCRRDELLAQVRSWRQAVEIRQFVADVVRSRAAADFTQWSAWALSVADKMDPVPGAKR